MREHPCPREEGTEQRGHSRAQAAAVRRLRAFMAHYLGFKGHLHSRGFLARALAVTHSSKHDSMHPVLLKSPPRGIQFLYYNESVICHLKTLWDANFHKVYPKV